mmetsp:Transcript_25592/g.35335  ORF Transcript_25592/g.35335 Transcript_25592/m.35335 type:complete len:270 (-) Transcript_25592:96-905(-)
MTAPTTEYALLSTATFFCLYWIIFTFGYFGPFAPRNSLNPKVNNTMAPTQRIAFANRCCSFSHAVADVLACGYVIWVYFWTMDASKRTFLPLTYDQESDPAFHWVLPILMGYCLADCIYMLIFERDWTMILHHLAVLFGVTNLYLMPFGWMMLVFSTFLAEITNPIQNTWQYTREYGPSWVYQKLSLPFTLAFGIIRGVLMPIFLVDFALFVFVEDRPPGSKNTYNVMGASMVFFTLGWFGSLVWLKSVVGGYMKYMRKKRLAEKGKIQ